MKKKRKPMRQQIEDAKSETTDESIYQGLATFLLVLIDKEDAKIEQIRRIWEAVQVLADKVKDDGTLLLGMVDKLDRECGIKIDPVYIPARNGRRGYSYRDVFSAKMLAKRRALHLSEALFLTVMHETEKWIPQELQRLWAHMDSYIAAVNQGYIKTQDILDTLRDEYEIEIKTL